MGLLTPFDDSLDIEHEKLADNARTLYDGGIRTFMAAANISEYHSLSQDERIAHARTFDPHDRPGVGLIDKHRVLAQRRIRCRPHQ